MDLPSVPNTPRARQQDPRVAQTRRNVIDAAAALLVDEGFERLTIESVAERSGVARSTIYRNWESRSALLSDAFDRLCLLPEVPDLGSLEAELRHLAHDIAAGLQSEQWAQALPSLVGASHHDAALVEAKTRFAEQRRTRTARIFERAQERGEAGPRWCPRQLAEYFSAPLFFRHLISNQISDSAYIEGHVATILMLAATDGPGPATEQRRPT